MNCFIFLTTKDSIIEFFVNVKKWSQKLIHIQNFQAEIKK